MNYDASTNDHPSGNRTSNRRLYTMEPKFTEYSDEYGSIALLSDPDNEHAWIQSTVWSAVER